MSYYPRGFHPPADEADDCDDYDATPYGGGYDITLTYGRPLPPSEETCYPPSDSTSLDYDYDRPCYDSYAQPCAYSEEALDNEYRSYARPRPRPVYAEPQPGFNRPGYGGGLQYGRPEPEYGNNPGHGSPESVFGSGYERPDPDLGSGYPGYGRPEPEFGSGYSSNPGYGEAEPGFGSGYGRRAEYGRRGGEEYGGYGRRPEGVEYGYNERNEYGDDEGYRGHENGKDEEKPRYEQQHYGRQYYDG